MKKVFFSLMCVSAMLFTLVSCSKDKNPDDGPTPTEKKALATPSIQISEQTENSFTVTWGEVANAASYKVSLNGTESDVAETSKKFEGLQAGEYTVKVKAVAAADSKEYKDSEWAESKVTIENGGTTPSDNPWVGTWTLSGDKAVVAEVEGEYVVFNKKDEPVSIDLTINEVSDDQGNKMLEISGLSVIVGADAPAYASFTEEAMDIVSGLEFQAGSDGFTPTWLSMCDYQDGVTVVSGQFVGISFSFKDENTATGVLGSGSFEDGSTFDVLAMEIFAVKGNQLSFYGDSFPYKYPTGNLTLTKKSSAVAEAPAAAPSLENRPVYEYKIK